MKVRLLLWLRISQTRSLHLKKGGEAELLSIGWRVILEWKETSIANSDGEFIFASLQ